MEPKSTKKEKRFQAIVTKTLSPKECTKLWTLRDEMRSELNALNNNRLAVGRTLSEIQTVLSSEKLVTLFLSTYTTIPRSTAYMYIAAAKRADEYGPIVLKGADKARIDLSAKKYQQALQENAKKLKACEHSSQAEAILETIKESCKRKGNGKQSTAASFSEKKADDWERAKKSLRKVLLITDNSDDLRRKLLQLLSELFPDRQFEEITIKELTPEAALEDSRSVRKMSQAARKKLGNARARKAESVEEVVA